MTPDHLHNTHEVHTLPSLAVIVSISSPVTEKAKIEKTDVTSHEAGSYRI